MKVTKKLTKNYEGDLKINSLSIFNGFQLIAYFLTTIFSGISIYITVYLILHQMYCS